MTISIKGIAVSGGIAIGRAHKLERGLPEIDPACIPQHHLDDEVRRLTQAIEQATHQLKQIRERIPAKTASDIAAFIDTHLLMLNDSTLSEVPIELIRTHQYSAEWALKIQLDSIVSVFDEMDDSYLKTRKDDVIHVVNRVFHILMGQNTEIHEETDGTEPRIIIADDLTPADIVLLQHQGMIGFITESGGPLSHTAIMAKSLKLPAIVGMHAVRQYINNNETLIVDGEHGVTVCQATEAIHSFYLQRQQQQQTYLRSLDRLRGEEAVTEDNIRVQVQANIELPEETGLIGALGVDGIGLFRTEYLFMNRDDLPDEDEQYAAYRQVVESMQDKPVTIRTLDLGADKQTRGYQYGECPTNPALGLRAIRLCLNAPELLKPQLRAILRASAHGDVRIMIPMLTNIHEIAQFRSMMDMAKAELDNAGITYSKAIPIGGMIEVPAAAICADGFAAHLDFLSIGTNDLIQYTLAIDRVDEDVNYLYSPAHPAILRLIHGILQAGRDAGIPVSMCGEMAGDPFYTRMLLDMGLREFSAQPNSVLEIKNTIKLTSGQADTGLIKDILACEDAQTATALIDNLNKQSAGDRKQVH